MTAPPSSSGTLRLRLYIAAESPNSVAAVKNLRAVFAERPEVLVELEIIDVLETPERGLRDAITVTPMLVKAAPLPVRRVLGRLSDRAALLGALDLE